MKILLITLIALTLVGCSETSNEKMKETQGPTLGEKVIGEISDKSTSSMDLIGDIVGEIDVQTP